LSKSHFQDLLQSSIFLELLNMLLFIRDNQKDTNVDFL